jgi:UEV domain
VDSSGLVYLPYLHEWNDRTHNLVQLCTALSGVFSQDPPVYTRQSREPQPIHQQRHAYATAHGAQQPHAASPQQQQQQQSQQWGSGSGAAAAGGGGSSGSGYRDDPVAEAKRALTAKLQSALQVCVHLTLRRQQHTASLLSSCVVSCSGRCAVCNAAA